MPAEGRDAAPMTSRTFVIWREHGQYEPSAGVDGTGDRLTPPNLHALAGG